MKGTSLLLSKSALTKDNSNDSVLVQLKFKSFYDSNISSLLVVVAGVNLEGVTVEEKEFQYMDMDISKYEEFGDRTPIYLDHNTIRKYNVRVRKIIFRDGSAKTIDDGDCAKVPANAFPFEGEIKEQYIRNIRVSGKGTPSAQHIPLRFGSFWMCSCGEINSESDSECRTCRCLSESLFKNLDIDVLTKDLTEHKQVEAEKAKEKKEKQASIIKKAAVACVALLVTIMAVMCFKNVISPAMKYSKAEKIYEEGNYEEAIAVMSELGDYKDAAEKIKQYKYDQAMALLEKGDKKGAKAYFKNISGYSDAKEKYEEIIKEEEYENAVVRVKSGQYDKALKVFIADPNYRDSAYFAGFILQEQGEYSNAINQYKSVSSSSEYFKVAAAGIEKCEAAIQEKEDTLHYNKGVDFAQNGYLFSAKKEFEESNGINNAEEYLEAIQTTIDEGWIGVYYSEDADRNYAGIFCKIDNEMNRTYIVVMQNDSSETSYSGVEIQDDGTMRIFDTIDDSVDAKRETVSLSQSKFKIQKNKDLYVNKGKGNVSGGGSFGRTKSFLNP